MRPEPHCMIQMQFRKIQPAMFYPQLQPLGMHNSLATFARDAGDVSGFPTLLYRRRRQVEETCFYATVRGLRVVSNVAHPAKFSGEQRPWRIPDARRIYEAAMLPLHHVTDCSSFWLAYHLRALSG